MLLLAGLAGGIVILVFLLIDDEGDCGWRLSALVIDDEGDCGRRLSALVILVVVVVDNCGLRLSALIVIGARDVVIIDDCVCDASIRKSIVVG